MGGLSKLKTVQGLDKYVLWFFMVLFVAIPIIRPLGLPIPIDRTTQEFYDTIESLPPGSYVWLGNEVTPGMMAEELPGIIAGLTHLMLKDVKVMIVTISEATPLTVFEQYVRPELEKRGVLKEYGVYWVLLPFVPGGESGLASLASDIRKTTPVDYYGTPLDDIPMMQGINSAADFDLAVLFSHTGPFHYYIRQINAPYKVKFIAQQLTMDVPYQMQYYPQQCSALLKGLGGAAEYEKLIGYPGRGMAATEGQSLTHAWIVAAVIAVNIHFIIRKLGGKK